MFNLIYYTFLNCYRTNSQILLYILFFSLRKNLTQFYIFPLPTKPRKTLFAGQKLLHEILFLPLLFGKTLFFQFNYFVLGGEDGRNSFLLLIRCPWHLISLNDICI